MDKLDEELWTALKPFQSPDGTWLQVGKRDFEQACAVIARKQVEELEAVLEYVEAEARRFAAFYPEASDGRNTFVIFADKLAALRQAQSTDGEKK